LETFREERAEGYEDENDDDGDGWCFSLSFSK
jgi:hypothetical protein